MVYKGALLVVFIIGFYTSGHGLGNTSLGKLLQSNDESASPATSKVTKDDLAEHIFLALLVTSPSLDIDQYQGLHSEASANYGTQLRGNVLRDSESNSMNEQLEPDYINKSLIGPICESCELRGEVNPERIGGKTVGEEIASEGKPFWFRSRKIEEGKPADGDERRKINNSSFVLKEETGENNGLATLGQRTDYTPLGNSGPETVNSTDAMNSRKYLDPANMALKIDENKTVDDVDNERVEVQIGDMTFAVCSKNSLCQSRCGQQRLEKHSRTFVNDGGNHNMYGGRRRIVEANRERNKQEKRKGAQSQRTDKQYNNTKQRLSKSNVQEKYKKCGNTTTCFCDEACVIFGDCCLDFFQSCFQINQTFAILDVIFEVRNKHDTNFSQNLIEDGSNIFQNGLRNVTFLLFSSCENMGSGSGRIMVTRCPLEFDDTPLRNNCENSTINLLPPVTANLIGGNVTFKNAFCARCHGIGVENVEPWLTNLECGDDFNDTDSTVLTMERIKELIHFGECNATYSPPSGTCGTRKCEPRSRLSEVHQQVIEGNVKKGVCTYAEFDLCQVYYVPGSVIKNPHCELCLNTTQRTPGKTIDLCHSTFPSKTPDGFPIPRGGGTPLTGGVLIILDITGMYSNKDQGAAYVCKDTEVFDPFFLECKTLICSHSFYPYKGECTPSTQVYFVPESSQIFPNGWRRLDVLTTTSEADSYISCDEVLGSSQLIIKHASFVVDKIIIEDYQDLSWISPMNSSTSLAKCEEFIAKENRQILQSVDLILTLTHAPGLDTVEELAELAKSLIKLAPEEDSLHITVTNLGNKSQNSDSCSDGGILIPGEDFRLVEVKGNLYAVFNFTQDGVYYLLNSIGYEFTIKVSDNVVTVSNTVYICQASELLSRAHCSNVVYWLNETERIGSRLKILKSNQYFDEGDFYISREKVFVCSHFEFNDNTASALSNVAYRNTNFVLTSISVLFLFLMLVIYCLLPELRTLPGKMTASLAGTMMMTFLFNLFSLVELRHDYVCPVMAAISHVVTLAHFGWMSAIAVNMALTFGPVANAVIKNQSDKNTFKIYNAIVWGLSVSLVTVSIILDITNSDTPTENELSNTTVSASSGSNYPRYGYPFCTWLSGPLWTRLSFIIIPYFITYIISLIGFIIAIVGIHKTSKHSEKFGIKTSDSARCIIYIKLSTAMGFSWITSMFVNIFPESEVLPYIHVFLVLLQGVLLFLAFMANKKVLSLLGKRFCNSMKETSESGTQISIVTSGST